MATVTGVTAERAQDIENKTIVSAARSGSDLVFKLFDGSEIKVTGFTSAAVNSWPIGSIFMNTTSTNPNILLGGGTWIRWGKGRVAVSVDEVQTEFDTSEETGGSKTHVLTLAELATHDHGSKTGTESEPHTHAATTTAAGNHSHSGTTATTGSHQHSTQRVDNGAQTGFQTGAGSPQTFHAHLEDVLTSSAGSHTHTVTTNDAGSHIHNVQVQIPINTHHHTISAQGSGAPHNNLQPYIAVYMWKRTA